MALWPLDILWYQAGFKKVDQQAETLKEPIVGYIQPGIHIVSDGWSAYAGIKEINHGTYSHDIVIELQHFKAREESHIFNIYLMHSPPLPVIIML